MPFDLIRYLEENFPRLFLRGPLFYRWSVALRFDLGGRAPTPDEQDSVAERATALYRAVFAAGNTSVVVSQDWPSLENPPAFRDHLSPLFVFAEREKVGLERPEGFVEVADPENAEGTSHTLTWAVQAARTFRYDLLFEGIANADHGRSPAISSKVYLINLASNVLFHMYDDRGLDVVARNRASIRNLYGEFEGWLLDHDRARMGQMLDV